MEGFGERLRRLRKSRDVTQSALAKHIGVVPSAVGKYELYSNSYPSVEAVVKIADYFDVSTDYLLRGIQTIPLVKNNINGGITNSSFVQANNGGVIVNDKGLSPEVTELVKIYEHLNGRDRLKLLNYAVDMEEGNKDNAGYQKEV
ncbi:MAG: helix-turn-helix transcriptional regulator [Schwartzia sp.]|nr:helix-turn-helix transcriptional regulator [Schwartzia sp. (in: firmicutes)]